MSNRNLSAVMPNRMASEFEKLYKLIGKLETKVSELEAKKTKNEPAKGGK